MEIKVLGTGCATIWLTISYMACNTFLRRCSEPSRRSARARRFRCFSAL